jgi:carboxypeptidase C (cathepsin A)
VQFFGKFPQFRQNPVFVTVESYGGVYVPTLVSKILDGIGQFPVNLKVTVLVSPMSTVAGCRNWERLFE